MAIRKAETTWNGTLKEGGGRMKVASGAFDVPYTWATRFADEPGTNPEELVGAAHAGCFTMYLSGQLTNAGFPPTSIHTVANVHFGRDETGALIEKIVFQTSAAVPGIGREKFDELVAVSKQKCPISRALACVAEFEVQAELA
jgi:osmotically inducible protein OsmC